MYYNKNNSNLGNAKILQMLLGKPMSEFNDLPINHTEIAQEELNINNRTRTNFFSWNGQFTPQFVEILLEKYANTTDIVIDPFVGSGTTLYECARRKIEAYGIELNVSAYYIAKIYETVNMSSMDLDTLLMEFRDTILTDSEQIPFVEKLKYLFQTSNNSRLLDLISAFIIFFDFYKNNPTTNLLHQKVNKLIGIIRSLPYSPNTIQVHLGDARCIPFKNNLADILITSPPYINVFNYHQNYRRSVELLGYDVLSIAKKEIGSNRKNRSNRLLTVIQYCIDMSISLLEASRVCKEHARMVYVVGRESNVLGYSFCNSELIYNIGHQLLGFPCILRQERVFKNRYGKMIFEDILHFENIKVEKKKEDVINGARNIAMDMLKLKLQDFPNNNREFITNALKKASQIQQSEV